MGKLAASFNAASAPRQARAPASRGHARGVALAVLIG